MLGGRLRAARHSRFVGRSTESALFQSALAESALPFQVLFVFGPGGVGKTTLLQEFLYICERFDILAIYLDVRNIEPSPEAFLGALHQALSLTPQDSFFEAVGNDDRRSVILIDTYETFTPLDDWVREIFLTQLPSNTLIVLAGRRPPSLAWRTDSGWQTLMQTISLRNLEPNESRNYLTRRQVPDDQYPGILSFTHGHPLALSLVADVFAQRREIQFQPEIVPDVVRTLLGQFVQKVPGPAHRAALEVCALVRLTTESLLAEMLMLPDAHELFEWLNGLSFIEIGPEGIFPHDLAREALITDLRWRNPEWYAELHRRARAYYLKVLQQTMGWAQQRVLFDYIFLHRDNPLVKPFFEWQISGTILTDVMQAGDIQTLKAVVATYEGEESARLASYWFSRRPQSALVWRDSKRQPVGFLLMISLGEVSQNDIEADPAVRSSWRYLQNHAPLRPGEVATLFRFWMAGDTYQLVSPVQSLIFVNMVRHYLSTPGLAYTFLPCADPDFWATVLTYADLSRVPSADFTVGEHQYGVYGHDWRTVPPMAWLTLLAERETGTTPEAVASSAVDTLIVLSKADFSEAVRNALRDFGRADLLRTNPLLRSRLVVERSGLNVGDIERLASLQNLLRDAVETLQQSPRQVKLYRALYHTYIQPSPTQEQAAELLDLPFSTYRRHLKAGLDQITNYLWHKEIGTLEK
jgi:hypothetical protein